jgi:hypothetical protein
MAQTTFSGPVVSTNGFNLPVSLTSELPAASSANTGQLRIVTDNGAGDDEFAVVVSNGTAWLAISTAALS